MPLFSIAAKRWLTTKSALAPNSVERFARHVATLSKEFGGRLIWDIGVDDIAALQRRGAAEGKTLRTVNYEVGTLRQILRAAGLWGSLSARVKSLRERHDVGRSISRADETKILDAISSCRSTAPAARVEDFALRLAQRRGLSNLGPLASIVR
jgi:hypothetical protein